MGSSQRPYSIRTRIKTQALVSRCITMYRQRPYSIRTRIKTLLKVFLVQLTKQVRDHIPLEQGLRPGNSLVHPACALVRDHIPLEQGLRLFLR